MRLFISIAATLGLCVCALLLVACSPQDGSAPAAASSSSARTANGSTTAANGDTTAPITKPPPAQHQDDTRRITVQETQKAIADGQALIVDVREESAYKTSHIRGAKSVPLPQFEKRAGELPKDKLIITYCA